MSQVNQPPKRIFFIAVTSVLVIFGFSGLARAAQENFLTLKQGWSAAEIEKAHHWNLGTELMPANWFSALERDDSSQKFSTDLERFGFVVKADGIPVGVTFDENEATEKLYGEKRWVGVNCAACHTSAIEIGGRTVLINGNQSHLSLQSFEEGIVKSIEATLRDSSKLARFAGQLADTNVQGLSYRLNLFRQEFKNWNVRNHHYYDQNKSEVRWGPGRIDGLGGSTNDLTCQLTSRMSPLSFYDKIFVDSRNCGMSQAPSSIPHLWGMANQDFVQWNGEVHASLGRNVGALMAGYGKNWVEPTIFLGIPKVLTTVKIMEVWAVEDLYKKLKAPSWRDLEFLQLVKNLDETKVQNGSRVYEKSCASCHAVQPKLTEQNKFGNRYWDYPMIPVKDVGTDPYYTTDEINRKTYISPVVAPLYLAAFGFSNIKLNGQVPSYAARGVLPAAALANFFREQGLLGQTDRMNNCRGDKMPGRLDSIKARSLEGVLFTAPYLHNGSVPTIADLLKRPEVRPKKFLVGCRKYDTEKFGYDCRPNEKNVFEFNTELQGNGNSGHSYGTDLTENEKIDLIEFIKSLEQPNYVPGNPACN